MYIVQSTIKFQGNSIVTLNNNKAGSDGGVMYIYHYSTVTFKENSLVTFRYNEVRHSNGRAVYCDDYSAITFEGDSTVTFDSNRAKLGGSVFIQSSSINFGGNSFVSFTNNLASRDGGAIYCSDYSYFLHFKNAIASFSFNTANDYGGLSMCYSRKA